jgi:hypothetical protein
LYINGYYHESIALSIDAESLDFTSNTFISSNIEDTFKAEKIYGISPETRNMYLENELMPYLINQLKLKLQL